MRGQKGVGVGGGVRGAVRQQGGVLRVEGPGVMGKADGALLINAR